MLLYLHGFESSPKSLKIQQLENFLQYHKGGTDELFAPQQPSRMVAIKEFLDQLVATRKITAVMGSSLGGFWTHYVVSQLHLQGQTKVRGVLINPAIQPQRWMPAEPTARTHPCTQEAYTLDAHDREILAQVERELNPQVELLVLLQSGDQQLDYCEARAYYRQQRLIVEHGGDHSFIDFPRYLPAVLEFLNVL